MDSDIIKQVLKTGECPECQAPIIATEDMSGYYCEQNRVHFDLKVEFHGGESISATLNGKAVPAEDLKDIEW